MDILDSKVEYHTPRQLVEKLNMSLKWVKKHTSTRRIPGLVKSGLPDSTPR